MKRVVIESPFSGDIENNVLYARRALRDSLARGEAPFASHLLYTQEGVLNDELPHEREAGMEAGFTWMEQAEGVVVYMDLGLSKGMEEGIIRAALLGKPIEFRRIGVKEELYAL